MELIGQFVTYIVTFHRFADKARQQADLEQLSSGLLTVVAETMQPEKVSLWIVPLKKRNH